jgi:CRP-like cAMP-binding protein
MIELDKKEFIKSIEIFRNFSDKAIEKLTEIMLLCNYNKGEVIFREGDQAEELFIIVSGEVVITKKVSPDTEKILSIIGSKSVFGEMGLFSNLVRSATAKAKTDLNLYKINCESFRKIFSFDLQGTQKVLELLLLSTLERLEQTSRELATVYEISKIITKNLSINEFCNTILTQICYSVPNVDGGIIFLWNQFTEEYEIFAKINSDQIQEPIPRIHPIINFIFSRIKNNEYGSIILNEKTEIKQITKEFQFADNIIITPLIKSNSIDGIIILFNTNEKNRYEPSISDLMNSISNQVVEAIENIRKKEDELAKERLDRIRRGTITW